MTSGVLDRLEVQRVGRRRPYECFDLGDDLRLEGRPEGFFFPAGLASGADANSRAAQRASLTSTKSRTRARKRRYSAIWWWVWSTAGPAGMIFVMVLPLTALVRDQLGPCPVTPGFAQAQCGFPHRR
jgi:hypothetical protein